MSRPEKTAVQLRAEELDTIAAVLPIERRDGRLRLILLISKPGHWLQPAAPCPGQRQRHCFSSLLLTIYGIRKSAWLIPTMACLTRCPKVCVTKGFCAQRAHTHQTLYVEDWHHGRR